MAQTQHDKQQEFEEKLIRVSRVSKKTKGGDQMSFSALMVVGDRKGKVGVGLGKAQDVVGAIRKGVRQAKRKMIKVPVDGTTIPFRVEAKSGAGHVLLKPAVEGSGVIAGGPVRAVVEAAGIKDISAKILGSDNQASSVYATLAALKQMNRIVKVRNISLKRAKTEDEIATQEPVANTSNTKTIKNNRATQQAARPAKKKKTVEKSGSAKPAASGSAVKVNTAVKPGKSVKPNTTNKTVKKATTKQQVEPTKKSTQPISHTKSTKTESKK